MFKKLNTKLFTIYSVCLAIACTAAVAVFFIHYPFWLLITAGVGACIGIIYAIYKAIVMIFRAGKVRGYNLCRYDAFESLRKLQNDTTSEKVANEIRKQKLIDDAEFNTEYSEKENERQIREFAKKIEEQQFHMIEHIADVIDANCPKNKDLK